MSTPPRLDLHRDTASLDGHALTRMDKHDVAVVIDAPGLDQGIQEALEQVVQVTAPTIRRVKINPHGNFAVNGFLPALPEDASDVFLIHPPIM